MDGMVTLPVLKGASARYVPSSVDRYLYFTVTGCVMGAPEFPPFQRRIQMFARCPSRTVSPASMRYCDFTICTSTVGEGSASSSRTTTVAQSFSLAYRKALRSNASERSRNPTVVFAIVIVVERQTFFDNRLIVFGIVCIANEFSLD